MTHPDDWLLIRWENIGFPYITQSDWELGLTGRIQTPGLGGADNDELSGLEERRWAVAAGPLIRWRRWPVHVQFRSYWEIPNRHAGTTSELEFSVALNFDRFDSHMSYRNLDLDRQFGDRINVGFGYNCYGTRLSAKNEDLRGTFRMRHHGPKLLMGFIF